MENLSLELKQFLTELHRQCPLDPFDTVSMYEVGCALGLDRAESARMAEALFMSGFAELKTLSGGISLTAMGRDELGIPKAETSACTPDESLGTDRVLGAPGITLCEAVLSDVKGAIGAAGLDFSHLEEVVMDVKTLEVQLLSPRPKTSVAREILLSISEALGENNAFSSVCERILHLTRGTE